MNKAILFYHRLVVSKHIRGALKIGTQVLRVTGDQRSCHSRLSEPDVAISTVPWFLLCLWIIDLLQNCTTPDFDNPLKRLWRILA